MRILYLDMPSGISGDMTLAAFLDAGVPEQVLRDGLARLGLAGYELHIGPGEKGGISGTHIDVLLTGADDHPHGGHPHDHHHHDHHEHGHHEHGRHENGHHEHGHHAHDGDHPHRHDHPLHGDHPHPHEQLPDDQPHGDHPHGDHPHGDPSHAHRTWRDIRSLIGESDLLPAERDLALRIFGRVARAEAKVHGVPLDTVGFHEVGAVDSIVDIVGAAVCFCWLQPDRVIASPVNTGSGFVRCQHGLLPVPAPATAEILMEGAVPAYAKGSPGERTTPTGAAIVAEIAAVYGVLPAMTIRSIGYGVGTKDFDAPNILRMIIGEAVDAQHGAFPLSSAVGKEGSPDLADVAVGKEGSPNPADVAVGKEQSPDPEDEVIVLEANLDDMTGEAAGYLLGRLLGAGARDAFHTPVYMKKNRPGMLLTVLADPADVEALERLIFQESSTIGIRKTRAVRSVMHRAFDAVEVAGNRIAIKVCTWQDICKAAPEYEDVRAAAERTGLPFRTVYRMAEQAWAARP